MSQSIELLQSQIKSMSSDRNQSSELDDFQLTQLMSDEEMISASLAILADYRQNPEGITHDAVKKWSDSLGGDNELPCPQ